MEALILAIVVAIIAILVYKLAISKKKSKPTDPHAPHRDQLYGEAMRWIEDFRTASAGLNTRKDLDQFLKENGIRIEAYSKYPEFVMKYNEILKNIKSRL